MVLPLGYFDAYSKQMLQGSAPEDIAARVTGGYGAAPVESMANSFSNEGVADALKAPGVVLSAGAPPPVKPVAAPVTPAAMPPAGPPTAAQMAAEARAPGPPGIRPDPGVQYIPGGVSSVPAHEYPLAGPVQAELMDRAYQTRQGAAAEAHDVNRQAAEERGRYVDMRRQQVENELAAQQEAKAKHLAERKALGDQIYAEHEQMTASKAPSLQIPKDAGTMLAIFLGGLFPGADGSNPALQAYQRQIDARMADYKNEYAHKKDALSAKETLYGRMVDEYGDSGAEEMLRANLAQRSMLEADAIAARNGLSAEDVNYKAIRSNLAATRDESLANMIGFAQGRSGQAKAMVYDPRIGVQMPADEYAKEMLKHANQMEEEGAKAGAKQHEKTTEGTRFIADKLLAAKVPEVEAAVDDALKQLQADESGVGIVGQAIRGIPKVGPRAYKAAYGDDASRREQAWSNVKNRLYSALSGSAVGPKEEERLQGQLDAAHDVESRREAIAEIKKSIEAQKRTINAGAGPEAAAAYKEANAAEKPKKFKESKY